MFSALLHRAQFTLDSAIGQLTNRLVIVTPFLIAGGFATAAAYLRLDREFGPETATLALAAGFAVIGLIAILALGRSKSEFPSTDQVAAASETTNAAGDETFAKGMSDTERDLILAAMASAAPVAVPGLIRILLKNLPLIAILIAAFYVITSPASPQQNKASPDVA